MDHNASPLSDAPAFKPVDELGRIASHVTIEAVVLHPDGTKTDYGVVCDEDLLENE